MNGKQKIKQINWFLLFIVVLSLGKLIFLYGLTIYPISTAPCDDTLLKEWALNIRGGRWTGPFSCYIYMKEVGFSVYLAVIHCLHLPYILATNLLYMAGCLIMLYAVSHIIRTKWVLCIIYVVLLFHPVMAAVQTGQRVYRNGFATALSLWVFGSLLNLYFEITEELFWKNCIWAVSAAGSLGFLWVTKGDTIWILPFTIVVMTVTAVILIKKEKGKQLFSKLILLTFPFLGILFFSKIVDILNTSVYGAAELAYYDSAMSILTGIESEDPAGNVSLSRETFRKLCALSPTLATAQAQVEEKMDDYDPYDTHPEDGNVEDGWIGWALIEGFCKAGYYESSQAANQFYQNVYEELYEAVKAGKIKLAEKSLLDTYHMSTRENRKELFLAIGKIWRYVASHHGIYSDVCGVSGEEIGGSESFELITRNQVYRVFQKDYYCKGWIAYPQYDLEELEVYIEDEKGNQFIQVEFEESEDVRKKYPDVGGAEKCRFLVEWNGNEEESSDFFLAAYQNGQKVAKARITENGLDGIDKKDCIGSVDGFYRKKDQEAIHSKAQRAVKRCNTVSYIYRFFGNFLAWAGMVAYVVFTMTAFREWKNKRYDTVNPWLAITGLGLSLLVLFAGVAGTDLEKCPTINYMYLSAAYPLFSLAVMLSIAKCAENVSRLFKKK